MLTKIGEYELYKVAAIAPKLVASSFKRGGKIVSKPFATFDATGLGDSPAMQNAVNVLNRSITSHNTLTGAAREAARMSGRNDMFAAIKQLSPMERENMFNAITKQYHSGASPEQIAAWRARFNAI